MFSDRSHLYLHDLSVLNTNRDRGLDGRRSVINFFNIQNFHYLALINIEFLDTGGFFSRGGGREDRSPAAQYFRFQNISYTAHGCDNPSGPCDGATAGVTVAKIWGYVDHLEWIDSVWDANVNAWMPQESGGPAGAQGIVPAQCSQDWVIRNNAFIDFKQGLVVQPESSQSCVSEPRPVKNITVDSNLFINRWPGWKGVSGIEIRGGAAAASAAAEDVRITNNVFVSFPGVQRFIVVRTGTNSGPSPGTITIAGNTFHGAADDAAIYIDDPGQSTRHGRFLIRNNIFAGSAGDRAITTEYAPNAWDSNFNVFPPPRDSVGTTGVAPIWPAGATSPAAMATPAAAIHSS